MKMEPCPLIIGWRKNGKPIFLIAGASTGTPEGQGGDLPDLLGDDQDGGDQGGDGGGDGGDQDGGDNQPPAWWQAASHSLQQQITQQTNSEIDRRINQLTHRRNQGGGQHGGQQSGQQQPPPTRAGVDPGDLRDARAVAREAVSDSGIKLSQPERELLATFLPGAIRGGLERDADPDRVGTDVATQFVAQIKSLRTHYQGRIITQLEQRGLLDRSSLKPGPNQGQGSQQNRTANEQWQAGQSKANELLERRGLVQPTTKTQ